MTNYKTIKLSDINKYIINEIFITYAICYLYATTYATLCDRTKWYKNACMYTR